MNEIADFMCAPHLDVKVPKKLVDKSQAYFWTRKWQEGEREADEDIKAGE